MGGRCCTDSHAWRIGQVCKSREVGIANALNAWTPAIVNHSRPCWELKVYARRAESNLFFVAVTGSKDQVIARFPSIQCAKFAICKHPCV